MLLLLATTPYTDLFGLLSFFFAERNSRCFSVYISVFIHFAGEIGKYGKKHSPKGRLSSQQAVF